jgi:resuscitation-promoting factor RpfB
VTSSSLFSRATRTPVLPVAAAVLTAAVVGGVAYEATGKTATLVVDGQSRTVDFRGDTAADVLAAAGLEAGERDSLVPAADRAVEDGDEVALRRARQLELTVDGTPKTVWVTAASVDEALDQVGLAERGLALSASRSRGIPADGMSLAVSTPKTFTVQADGRAMSRTTTASTVGEALTQAGVRLDGDDRVSHDRAAALVDGLAVNVVRVERDHVHREIAVPNATERREDAALAEGRTRVVAEGSDGVLRRTFARTFLDGKLASSTEIAAKTVAAPVTRVVAVGTKPAPAAPAPAAARPSSPSSPSRASSSGGAAPSGGFAALAQCESGGNPRATNPSGKYRGLYQFSRETWASVGGSGDPAAASVAEQTKRAQLLLNRSGAGQWPECGRHLR